MKIRGKHEHRYVDESRGRFDNEFVETYRLDNFSGEVKLDPSEVSEFKYATLDELSRIYQKEPETLTPWLRAELKAFSELPGGINSIRTVNIQ